MTIEPSAQEAAGDDFGAWELVLHYLTPIQALLQLDDVSEIMVNRYDEIFVERNGSMERVKERFTTEEELAQAITQIGNALNQPVDPRHNPILDARLRDGSRVCGVLWPNSARGSSMSIRVFPKRRLTSQALVDRGSLTKAMLDYLKKAVIARSNILVSGGTSSGKTTLLNTLSSFIPRDERVITVEDTKELQLDLPNLVCLEAPHRSNQRPNQNGAVSQHIDMAYLIRTTLRMNPTRVFVGEIRDLNAAVSFLHAINTGHDGTCSTIHANDVADALTRMQTLVAGGGGGALPYEVVRAQVRANLDVLIHAENTPRHGRRVVEIAELRNQEVFLLWSWDYVNGVHIAHQANLDKSIVVQDAEKYQVDASTQAARL